MHGIKRTEPFRVALLVDDLTVSQGLHDFAHWIEHHSELELCGLVVHPAPQRTLKGIAKFLHLVRSQGVYTAVSRAAFALLVRLESAFEQPVARRELQHPTVIIARPIVSPSGFVYDFSPEDLAAIRALQADVLIRCGNGILKGGILKAATHGVLSIHHGDNRVNRGGPAGFWEVLLRQPYTGFIVQRLTEELDGGEVLFRGTVTTRPTYLRNQANLSERCAVYLPKVLLDLMAGKARAEEPMLYDGRLYRTPLLHHTLAYLLKTATFLAGKAARKALGRRWNWGVAYAWSGWRNAVLWRGKCIPNPPGHFLADPFVMEHHGKHYLFVEDYSYSTRKGSISAYSVTTAGAQPLGVVLEEGFHLSFPFVFRDGETIYMVPESSGNLDVRLYRCVEFPLKWELAGILVQDVHAVDTMIFQLDGWWMLTTINPTQSGANDAELHLLRADQPTGPWTACESPVFMDASKGRCAGILRDGQTVYRVAQRHGFCQYGAGCSIYRIETLQPYRETLVQDISPNFMPRIKGTHHMHQDGGLLAFDFLRDKRPDYRARSTLQPLIQPTKAAAHRAQ